MSLRIIVFAAVFSCATLVYAQNAEYENPVPTGVVASGPAEVSIVSSREFWQSAMILVFGAIVLLIEYLSLRSREQTTNSGDIIRLYGVTLILVGVLFVIVAGFDADQIAPALGLFGTVAGYLLGKSQPDKN